MTLNEVPNGATVTIDAIGGSSVKTRLMSMGLIQGTKLQVMSRAPLGEPMAVKVRSYKLAIRLADAGKISVSM